MILGLCTEADMEKAIVIARGRARRAGVEVDVETETEVETHETQMDPQMDPEGTGDMGPLTDAADPLASMPSDDHL